VGLYEDYLETKALFDLQYDSLMNTVNNYFNKKEVSK
jgi:hypothetical protein